jgi:hypothetical protein
MNINDNNKLSSDDLIQIGRDMAKKNEELRLRSTQLCPICGDKVIENSRYPVYLCEKELNRATDSQGKIVKLNNRSVTGGFIAFYENGAEATDVTNTFTVYIDGKPYHVAEAKMGGVVVTPIEK